MKCACLGCLVVVQLLCHTMYSQYYFSANNQPEPEWMWELGAVAGGMNCLTDLGGNNGSGKKFIKDINWNQSRFCAGVFASTTWQSQVAIRLQAMAGQVSAADAVLKNSPEPAKYRYLRNLQFKSTVLELSLLSEIHLLALLNKHDELPLFSPYMAAGIGFFYYNPQAQLNNVWTDLRALHTEGQGFREYPARHEYKSFSWCIPAGAGIKYDAGRQLNCRLELLYRFTGTDYLDDVSTNYINPALFSHYLSATAAATAQQLANRSGELPGGSPNPEGAIRGNQANKDAYFSLCFSISIALGRIPGK